MYCSIIIILIYRLLLSTLVSNFFLKLFLCPTYERIIFSGMKIKIRVIMFNKVV